MSAPVIVALTARGAALAERLRERIPRAEIHGYAPRVSSADSRFDDASEHLRALFGANRPIVGVCAAGILIRALAPLIDDKRAEPPVVALAEDGSVAVPLLGGHRGANTLARDIAAALSGVAAITTASDLSHGIALDTPPPGWRIADPEALKTVAAGLIAGDQVSVVVEAADANWLGQIARGSSADAPLTICITHRDMAADARTLVYHPPVLALGLGCERDTAPEELHDLARSALAANGLSVAAVACVVSLDRKEDEPAIHALAAEFGVPARFFSAEQLAAEEPRLVNPSTVVRRAVGIGGVAEAAALAAAGAEARLIVAKTRSARATAAVALSPAAIDARCVGRRRGALTVVGIGPGGAAWRTAEAIAAIVEADEVVGYGLYLDLVADLIAGKRRHESPLGAEEARVKTALVRAAEGRNVALISSGDAGIYGMAALAVELVERGDDPAWARIGFRVAPGVSALQAAAARIGAPLGHDFCAISLSDLLTPWEAIEQRLAAAAAGDFVTALYNPGSQQRRWQFGRAIEILGRQRPATTPCVVARNLGRRDEQVAVTSIAQLKDADIDMLTLVLVGSSRTRRVRRAAGDLVYTPRGYTEKNQAGKRVNRS